MRSLLANFSSSSTSASTSAAQSDKTSRSERDQRRSTRSGTFDRRTGGHAHGNDHGDQTLTYEQASKARAFGYGPVASSTAGGTSVLDAAPSRKRATAAGREHASSSSLSRGFGSFRSKGTKRQASHADLITSAASEHDESRSQKTLRTSQSLGGGELVGRSEHDGTGSMRPPRSPRRMQSQPSNPPSSHSTSWRGYQAEDHTMSDPTTHAPSSYTYANANGSSNANGRRESRSDLYADPMASTSPEPFASSSASMYDSARSVVPKGTSVTSGRPPSTFASIKGRFSSLGKASGSSSQQKRQEQAALAYEEQRKRERRPSAPPLPASGVGLPQRTSSRAPPTPTAPATLSAKSLAVQLNELAVANGDGLLADDEYRMLRQSLFDRLAAGEAELPKEAAIGAVARNKAGPQRSSTVPEPGQGYLSAPEREASLRSQRSSVTSLFRRVTRSKSTSKRVSERPLSIRDGYASPSGWSEDQHGTHRHQTRQNGGSGTGQASNSSIMSSGAEWDSRSGAGQRTSSAFVRAPAKGSKGARARAAEMEQNVSSARSARSLRGATMKSSTLTVGPSSRAAASEGHGYSYGLDAAMNSPAGRSRSSLVDASARSLSGLSLSSANGMLGVEAAHKPSAELQAEIAVVEAEGRRLVEAFNALEAQTVGRYRVDGAQLKRIYASLGPGGVDMLRGGSSSTSLVVPEDHAGPSSPVERPKSGASNRLSFFRKRSSASVASPRPLSSISSVDSTTGAITPNGLTNGAHTYGVTSPAPTDPERLSPTSYFRPNSSASIGGRPAGSPRSPFFGGTLSPGGEGSGGASGGETDPELASLRAELATIAARRKGVVDRYDERLGLLRSRLRSARIKEGLRG